MDFSNHQALNDEAYHYHNNHSGFAPWCTLPRVVVFNGEHCVWNSYFATIGRSDSHWNMVASFWSNTGEGGLTEGFVPIAAGRSK